jgi:DNA-binding NarL/FixJ family response regulator
VAKPYIPSQASASFLSRKTLTVWPKLSACSSYFRSRPKTASSDARGERIDLVLTDVVLPVQGGRVLGERLAMHWPGIRVLYMSGYTDDEILRRGPASFAS